MSLSVDKKRRQERIGPAATAPTVPTVADHLTPGWLTSDIYKGEFYFSLFSGRYRLWSRDDAGVFEIPLTPSGLPSFTITDLTGEETQDEVNAKLQEVITYFRTYIP